MTRRRRAEHDGKRGERGSALVVALLMLAVLTIIGVVFLDVSLSERRVAVNETRSGKAFNVAEAGLEHGRVLIPGIDVDAVLAAGGNLLVDVPLEGGAYDVTLVNNVGPEFPRGIVPADPGGPTVDTDAYLLMRSSGTFAAAERELEVVIEQEVADFPYTLFGRTSLKMTGSGVASPSVGSNGDIAFSGGSPAVDGDASAGGVVGDPGYVTGTSTDGADPRPLPDVTCPAIPFGGTPGGAGVSFDATSGDLKLSGGGNKVFGGGTYFYRDFSKSGSGNIVVPVGQRVEIYLSGQLSITGSGFLNHNNAADFLKIYACGNDTSAWSFSGSAATWLVLYAPNHDLSLSGSGAKYGSFVGDSVTTSGSAPYGYDQGLRLPSGRYVILPGSWVESRF